MSNAVLSPSRESRPPAHSRAHRWVATALAAWLGLILLLGAEGVFSRPPGSPPLPTLVGVVVPIAAFLFAYRTSRGFRDVVLTVDLRVVTAIQAWRFAGLGFLDLYALGVLPGLFAWPAGLGDVAIGVTAPWLVLNLARRPGFATSKAFATWNAAGMLDLVVALSTAALSTVLIGDGAGAASMGPMTQLPLVLIPGYLVPFFAMLHLTALLQRRRRMWLSHAHSGTASPPSNKSLHLNAPTPE